MCEATAGRVGTKHGPAVIIAHHKPITVVVLHEGLAEHELDVPDAHLWGDGASERVDIGCAPRLEPVEARVGGMGGLEAGKGFLRVGAAVGQFGRKLVLERG